MFFLSGYAERPLHLLGGAGVTLGLRWDGGLRVPRHLLAGYSPEHGGPSVLVIASLLVLTGVQLLVVGLIAEMINNLERSNVGRSKIAQVLRVDRRSSLVLAPGVQVERRQGVRGQVPGRRRSRVRSRLRCRTWSAPRERGSAAASETAPLRGLDLRTLRDAAPREKFQRRLG